MIKLISYQVSKSIVGEKRIRKLFSGNKEKFFNNKKDINALRKRISKMLNASIYLHYTDNECKIFVMNGSGGSGKDTFVKAVMLEGRISYYKTSIIEWVKEQLNYKEGKTPKTEEIRKQLSDYLDEHKEEAYNILLKRIEDNKRNYVFVDIREPGIIKRFVRDCENRFNVKPMTIHISRPGYDIVSNHADANTKEYNYDVYIVNKDLKEFIDIAIQFRDKHIC